MAADLVTDIPTTEIHSLLKQLTSCKCSYDVLKSLFRHAKSVGLTSLRYYRYLGDHSRMVSVDCVGHEEMIQNKLRSGRISQDPSKPSPSFYSIKHRQPVVFRIDATIKVPFVLTKGDESTLPCCVIRDDECAGVLDEIRSAANCWVDIPLVLSNRVIGKLSCDVDDHFEPTAPRVHANVLAFCQLANYTAPYLVAFASFDLSLPLQQAMEAIGSKKKYSSLYRYCTHELRTLSPLAYDYVNLYVVSEDDLESHLLILRASSCGRLTDDVNVQCFLPQENGPVPWVWRNGRAVRLHLAEDQIEMDRQLDDYPGLIWRGHCRHHNLASILVVPIRAHQKLMGVLCCGRKGPNISPHDQLLLQDIADYCLGPKMISLRNEEFAIRMRNNLKHLHLELIEDATTSTDLAGTLRTSLEAFFPTNCDDLKPSKNLIKICLIDRKRQELKAFLIGGEMETDVTGGDKYPLQGTLTNLVVTTYENTQRRSIFVNDLDNAAQKGSYLRTEPTARCALASVITYDGVIYGALIVLSDTYNILPTQYGRLIELISSQLGQIIARREVIEFSSFITNLRHDCNTPLVKLSAVLERNTGEVLTTNTRMEMQRQLDFINDAIFVHCRRGPMKPEAFRANIQQTVIVKEVRHAAVQALLEATDLGESELDAHLTLSIDTGLILPIASPFLLIAVFNLLKNAWQADPAGKAHVTCRTTRTQLVVTIENACTAEQRTRIDAAVGDGLPQALHTLWYEPGNSVKASGMRLVQRILNWYRITPGAGDAECRGTFEYCFPSDELVRFVLAFPLPNTVSQGVSRGSSSANT